MKARPILFSGPMVRALLEGRKTQTRRVVKGMALDWLDGAGFTPAYVADPANALCPYGVPGDLLMVRETWACHFATDDQKPREIDPGIWSVRYLADGEIRPARSDGSTALPEQFTKTRVSIHMPRWASRLTLRIADIRIERLQEISEADVVAEGVETYNFSGWGDEPGIPGPPEPDVYRAFPEDDWSEWAAGAYGDLWRKINGTDSWDANPWVWVVDFKFGVHPENVDKVLEAYESAERRAAL